MPQPSRPTENLTQLFYRYEQLIVGLLNPSSRTDFKAGLFRLESEGTHRVQVERGIVFLQFLLQPLEAAQTVEPAERLIEVSRNSMPGHLSIVDRAGHTRPVYRPLLAYCWMQAFRLGYELIPHAEFGRWEEATRAWCDDLEFRLGEFIWPASELPASSGDRVAEVCWIALTLHIAGKVFIRDAWTDLAGDVFGKLVRRQRDTGAFLTTTLSDNPETHWFHELVILQAAASYAVQAEDRALASAVARATRFHQNETQPDHATNQPWGLFAFLWNPDTRSVADGMLSTLQIHGGASGNESQMPGLTLMLLADALYCLRLFKGR